MRCNVLSTSKMYSKTDGFWEFARNMIVFVFECSETKYLILFVWPSLDVVKSNFPRNLFENVWFHFDDYVLLPIIGFNVPFPLDRICCTPTMYCVATVLTNVSMANSYLYIFSKSKRRCARNSSSFNWIHTEIR